MNKLDKLEQRIDGLTPPEFLWAEMRKDEAADEFYLNILFLENTPVFRSKDPIEAVYQYRKYIASRPDIKKGVEKCIRYGCSPDAADMIFVLCDTDIPDLEVSWKQIIKDYAKENGLCVYD